MAFNTFKREDHVKRNDIPEISIRTDTIAFNAELTKKAELNKYTRTIVQIDEDNYLLGFHFTNDENNFNSFRLYSDGISKSNRVISSRQLINKYKWIGAITKLKFPLDRHFPIIWNNIDKLWVVSLRPAFENVVSRESQIGNIKGIYQYKRGDEIVYIGKGNIKSRATEPERKHWEFDTIEYSIIDNPETQSKWETYWLDKFATEHKGLPLYNKIKGIDHTTSTLLL